MSAPQKLLLLWRSSNIINRSLLDSNYSILFSHQIRTAATALVVSGYKVKLPVVEDPQILHDYVCGSNLLMEEGQDVKVKEDHEYPDWLWTIRTGKPPPLEELDPESKYYWKRVRLLALRQQNNERKTRKFN